MSGIFLYFPLFSYDWAIDCYKSVTIQVKTINSMSKSKSKTDRPEKRPYSIKEASVYLGRSVGAVREMIWAGKLPYVRADRRIFLDIYDMDEWIERNKMKFIDWEGIDGIINYADL